MTAHPGMFREMELRIYLFGETVKPTDPELIKFKYLLVAQFNLQQVLALINVKLKMQRQGKPAQLPLN
jgi:hypothetical protein